MKKYTQQEIEDLISCPKDIFEGPRGKMVLAGAHWRDDMKLQSDDKQQIFSVYMRKNCDF